MRTTDQPEPAGDANQDWNDERRALWQRLRDYRFGGDQAQAWLDRVAHACGSDRETAEAALEEYRRFCFLAVAAGHAVTPSEIVDKVWHVHLTDTRDYWMRFCPQTLRRDLHHSPSLGGQIEDARHQQQYRDTLASYQVFFGEPRARFWPQPRPLPQTRKPAVRTSPSLRLTSQWASEPKGWGVAVWAFAGLTALVYYLGVTVQGTVNPFNWRGGGFLGLYLTALPFAYVAGSVIKRSLRGPNRRNQAQAEDEVELAYLAGGAERAADTALVGLMQRGVIRLDYPGTPYQVARDQDPVWLRIDADLLAAANLPPSLATAAGVARREENLFAAVRVLQRAYLPVAAQLRRKGWWLSGREDALIRIAGSVPLLVLAVFGAIKIAIGVLRDRPVGFLVVLLGLTVLLALVRLARQQRRTRAGDWALHDADLKLRANDLAAHTALMGTIALVGSPFGDYHTLRTPVSNGNDSSSGSSGGDGGGGGCGGGGCGGCGG